MNALIVPPAPHWYKNAVMACAPDNTLIYGSKNDIVVIKEKTPEAPAEVQLIAGAHSKHVTSISLNRKWKEPHCYVASLGEDSVIKVWDLETLQKKTSNKDHTEHKDSVIGAIFAGDDRVVSATVNGYVNVWNINANESKPLKDLFKSKVTLTCLSSCPHAGWLLAFGLNNGGVVVADLRRNGQVLYKLRGHYQPVVSLSWCPAPVNVFPSRINNTVKNKALEAEAKKENPWVNLVHADDEKVQSEETDEVNDFLKECNNLKAKILGLEVEPTKETTTKVKKPEERVEVEDDRRDEVQNRALPTHFDPSGDFLDDSGHESLVAEEKAQGVDDKAEDEVKQPETKGEEEPVEEEPRTEYLLASAGKDQSVYIWRAGTDGRMQTFFQADKRSRKDKNLKTFTSLCWVTPDTILTSSTHGEVLAWPVPKPRSSKQFKVVHSEHSSLIFNIVTPPIYTTAYNFRESYDTSIWSWGQDGKLINFDLNSNKARFSFTTVTSLVTCCSSCPLDPNRLAIGLRDGGLYVWDLSLPMTNIIELKKYQQKYTQKISSIEWHPFKEMILGFGTEEGRVGFIDLNTKKSTVFPHYFRTHVYKVEWGPLGDNVDCAGLYALAEGNMVIYNVDKPSDDPIRLELPEKLHVYRFAWKPNFRLLLINGKDGSLLILKSDLKAITTVYPADKGINSIVWHPDAFIDNVEVSLRCNWVAFTTPKGVLVADCSAIEDDNFTHKSIANFEGHIKPPLALAWCPFDGNKIVSTASDGLAQVWDVSKKCVVSTFIDPYLCHNPVVAWSPLDEDLVIMGDKFLRIWKVSSFEPNASEEFLSARKKLLSKSGKKDAKSEKNKIKVEVPQKVPKNCIVPKFYVSNDENIAMQVAKMRSLMNKEHDVESAESLDPLQLFGTKEQVTNLLDANYLQQKNGGKHKSCQMISLWKGNVSEFIRNAINDNRVTPSIITLAPMVSTKLYQEACYTYAKKLSEEADSDPLETATYFLACHKVEEAINSLCQNNLFSEALALVKHRLPENSEFIKIVLEKWAAHCECTGNFETAAYCYIAAKDYEKAALVLSRRSHREFLELAAELAEKCENKTVSDAIQKESSLAEEVNSLSKRIQALLDDFKTGDSDDEAEAADDSLEACEDKQ